MKKKIAVLLAAVMVATMLPMSVFASSSNKVDKTISIKQDEYTTGSKIDDNTLVPPKLSIDPSDEISSGTSVRLILENGEWTGDSSSTVNTIDQGYNIPWELKVSSGDSKVAILTLSGITSDQLKGGGKDATYDIPLKVKCIAEGDVKVTVDGSGTSISSSTITFAIGTATTGATVASVSDVVTARDSVQIKPLTIKETVSKTFEAGKKITLQLNGDFEFDSTQKIMIASDFKMGGKIVEVAEPSIKGDTITFKIPNDYMKDETSKLDTIYITRNTQGATNVVEKGIKIDAIDEDEDYGDVNMIIKGEGITRQTLKVGVRKDYGFEFKTLEDVPTILAGRVAEKFEIKGDATDADTGIDEELTESAQFLFKESIVNTWLATRKLTFTVPEGVKIEDFKVEGVKNMTAEPQLVPSKDGRTLTINNPGLSKTDLNEFKVTLWLSAELAFEGDVAVEVAGGGIAAGTIPAIVVAKVIPPIKIESATTNINLGYQKLNTADIKITEAVAGTFVKGKTLFVKLSSLYGGRDLGFVDENLDYEVEGGLTVKDLKVVNNNDDAYIKVTIDKVSKDGPSSITFKNVKIGSSRAVPFGTYDLLVYGDAFATNFDDEINSLDYAPLFDKNEGYKFKDYIKVVTETGTLDEVVKVSIGSNSCLINEVATEMDVAPYIQQSSGSTMVPLRFVSLALGIDSVETADESSKIQYDPNSKTVTIFYAAGTNITPIQFTANSSNMSVGGTVIPMVSPGGQPVKAEITDSRMFVPFRALGDALGIKVTWDDATKTAIYNQK